MLKRVSGLSGEDLMLDEVEAPHTLCGAGVEGGGGGEDAGFWDWKCVCGRGIGVAIRIEFDTENRRHRISIKGHF